jgi:hypothetical protein
MKITKITEGTITSKGITFNCGEEVEVSKEVGQYLLNTFPSTFQSTDTKTSKGKDDDRRDSARNDESVSKKSRRPNSNKRKSTER